LLFAFFPFFVVSVAVVIVEVPTIVIAYVFGCLNRQIDCCGCFVLLVQFGQFDLFCLIGQVCFAGLFAGLLAGLFAWVFLFG
jgi:hypothetical protein